jgi:hypothetical protein
MNLHHYECRAAYLERMAAKLQESDLRKPKLNRLANEARRKAVLMALCFRMNEVEKPSALKV